MSDYIKVCATCDHYPNDKHCIGCKWDKRTGDNTKWESHKYIDRKVIEDIRAEIEELDTPHDNDSYVISRCLEIIDRHIGERTVSE